MIYLTQVPGSTAQNKLLHKAAWALLTNVLRRKAPQVVLAESLRFGPHGKPFLEGGPFFSISHTKGLALCAVEDWDTGIDTERRREFPPHLQERVFTIAERETAASSPDPGAMFTTLWTLKESYMKYTGMGLAEGAESLCFRFQDGQPVLDGKELCFRTVEWKGYSISQCGPVEFELELCPIGFDSLRLKG